MFDFNDSRGADSEYIVFLEHQDSINPEELNKVYDIINTYRFPLNTLPANQEAIRKLSKDELQLLHENEFAFIKAEIQKINPSLCVMPIPKSLYQLFVFARLEGFPYSEERRNVDSKKTRNLTNRQYDDLEYLHKKFDFNCRSGNYFTFCDQFRNLDQARSEWIILNGAIANVIRQHQQELLRDATAAIKKIFDSTYEGLFSLAEKKADRECWDKYSLNSCRRALLVKKKAAWLAVAQEWQTRHSANVYTVYRAGDFTKDMEFYRNHLYSLSYSDGIFAGMFHDQRSGSALSLVSQKRLPLQVLVIDRKKYLAGEEDAEFIFIPPISSYCAVKGAEEFHHPRGKVSQDMAIHSSVFGTKCEPKSDDSLQSENLEFLYAQEQDRAVFAAACEKYLTANTSMYPFATFKLDADYMRMFSANNTAAAPAGIQEAPQKTSLGM